MKIIIDCWLVQAQDQLAELWTDKKKFSTFQNNVMVICLETWSFQKKLTKHQVVFAIFMQQNKCNLYWNNWTLSQIIETNSYRTICILKEHKQFHLENKILKRELDSVDYCSIKVTLHKMLSHCRDYFMMWRGNVQRKEENMGSLSSYRKSKSVTLIYLSLNLLFGYLWDYLFILTVVIHGEGKKNK